MGMKGKRQLQGEAVTDKRPAQPNGDTNRSLLDIEIALADEFHWLQNLVVFNVNGLSGRLNIQHECDMLVLSKNGYLTEVEIKRTFADFCNEFKKNHHHESYGPDIKEFWYCIPVGIFERCLDKLTEMRWIPTGFLCYDEDLRFSQRHVVPSLTDDDLKAAAEHRKDAYGRYRLGFTEKGSFLKTGSGAETVRLFSYSPQPLFLEQQLELARLGAMRQVSLRKKIKKLEDPGRDPDARLRNKVIEQDVLLKEYRKRYREDTGMDIDEKEVLYG